MVCLRYNMSRVSSLGSRLEMWSAHGVIRFLVPLILAVWLTKRPPFPQSRDQVSDSGELRTHPLDWTNRRARWGPVPKGLRFEV